MPILPVLTPRLVLRPYDAADRDETLRLMADPVVGRFLLAFPREGDAADQSFRLRLGSGAVGEGIERLQLAVAERDGGRYVGEICLINIDWPTRTGELGYMLTPAVQGRGYGFEAARAMLALAFGPLALRRVTAHCDDRNTASWRVMEKLGLRREARFVEDVFMKGEWVSSLVYAILAREWRAATAAS